MTTGDQPPGSKGRAGGSAFVHDPKVYYVQHKELLQSFSVHGSFNEFLGDPPLEGKHEIENCHLVPEIGYDNMDNMSLLKKLVEFKLGRSLNIWIFCNFYAFFL